MGLGTGGRLQAGWAGEQVVRQAEHCVVKFFPSDSLGAGRGVPSPEGNATSGTPSQRRVTRGAGGNGDSHWGTAAQPGKVWVWCQAAQALVRSET